MWTCKICDTEVEDDTWTQCWKCSTTRHLEPAEVNEIRGRFEERVARFQHCLRCQSRIDYVGTKSIRDDSERSILLGDMFVQWDTYDVYVCPKCGKVEFYMDGIGDTLRGEASGA